MPVQEFECQIARGQIGRYLNGEQLSAEALRQLGAHVAECSECKIFLDNRKAALQGMLGEGPMPTRQEARAVVDVNPSEALIAQIRARSVPEEPVPAASMPAKPVRAVVTKPIIYSGLLGLVLLGMTYVNRNPSGLLGPHASSVVAAAPINAAGPKLTAAAPNKPTIPAKNGPAGSQAQQSAPAPPPVSSKPTGVTNGDVKTTSGGQPTGVKIAPTKVANSPIILDSHQPDPAQTRHVSKLKVPKSAPPKPGPGRPAAATKGVTRLLPNRAAHRPTWRRRAASRPGWNWRHLKPGTGAIHVYRS
ncbi:MAG: zf-HC2 domain-containing protein [Fimbriimonadaceae bacterium]